MAPWQPNIHIFGVPEQCVCIEAGRGEERERGGVEVGVFGEAGQKKIFEEVMPSNLKIFKLMEKNKDFVTSRPLL